MPPLENGEEVEITIERSEEGGNGGDSTPTDIPIASETEGEGEKPELLVETEEPAYTPNFKYKVMKEEKEIPEFLRSVVTSPEVEKQVRELYEKAEGLDHVKTHRDQLSQENTAIRQEFEEKYAPFLQDASEAIAFAKKGDLTSFFSKVGLADDAIIKYALDKVELLKDPARHSAYEQSRALELRNAELERQSQSYQQSFQQVAAQQREFELSTHLGKSDIAPAAEAFNTRMGDPHAFRNEVIKRGQLYAAQQIDAPVDQVVSEVIKLIGWTGQQSAPTAVSSPKPAETAPRVIPPSLPNIKGNGTSPAKREITSIADIRARAKTLE